MLSINKKRLIVSLSRKKQRQINKLFIAEGQKLVRDLVEGSVKPSFAVVVEDMVDSEFFDFLAAHCEIITCSVADMKDISQLTTPSSVLGVFHISESESAIFTIPSDLILMLDGIQDPGNMGTIVRIADWFGIHNIICSDSCVDLYNAKVVQSTMGALARVSVVECDLVKYLTMNRDKWKLPVYGTFLEGESIYNERLSSQGVIVMGSEGKGISGDVAAFVTHKLLIPSFPTGGSTSESLNVSTATAIVCSEFRRRTYS